MATYFEPFFGSGAVFFEMFGAKPFLKWAGSKRELASKIAQKIPKEIWSADRFRLNDANDALMTATSCILDCDSCDEVLSNLEALNDLHFFCIDGLHKDLFKENVQLFNILKNRTDVSEQIDVLVSALFIYINRMGFNGLYRENKAGKCNVPIGSRTQIEESVYEAIRAVSKATFRVDSIGCSSVDYKQEAACALPGDFVYFDPPYLDMFKSYTKSAFGLREHKELLDICQKLHDIGVQWILSGADSELYRTFAVEGKFNLEEVSVGSAISGKAEGRKKRKELLIWNFQEE